MQPNWSSPDLWAGIIFGAVLSGILAPFLNVREWRRAWAARLAGSRAERAAKRTEFVARLAASAELRAFFSSEALHFDLLAISAFTAFLVVGFIPLFVFDRSGLNAFFATRHALYAAILLVALALVFIAGTNQANYYRDAVYDAIPEAGIGTAPPVDPGPPPPDRRRYD
jgi:hypothetical protein